MEKSNPQNSGSSSGSSSIRRRSRVAGIPKKCWCGSGIVQKISGSEENPCRLYFRCGFAYANRLRDDPHVFKWVDEAFRNEIERVDYQVSVIEQEVIELKHGRDSPVNGEELQKQYEKFKMDVFENVEDVLAEEKKCLKRLMAMVFIGCVFVVVLGMFLSK